MDFENPEAEKAYKEIVNSSGIAFYEIVGRAEEYDHALRENDTLRPETLERSDRSLRALETLEDAGLVMENGDFNSYDVEADPDVYGEVFGKIAQKRKPLVNQHD